MWFILTKGGSSRTPHCNKRGIMTHLTAAYTRMQDGTVERVNRTIGDAVRAMLTGGGMEAKHWDEAACSFVLTRNAMPRKCFSGKSTWEQYTGQSPPSLPDYFFGQKVLYWQPSVKRDKWEAPGVEAHYLSKAVHLLRYLHPGCFRVRDEVKQDVVITTYIKLLSMLPTVESFLQDQQNGPGEHGEVKYSVPSPAIIRGLLPEIY